MSEGAFASFSELGASLPGSGLDAAASNDAGLQKVAEAFDQAVDHVSNRNQSLTQQLGVPEATRMDAVDRTMNAMRSDAENLKIGSAEQVEQSAKVQDDMSAPVMQLQNVMNFATEMHLFVRTTTQISSSVNTLTKGQ